MKVFISWSGELSHKVAIELRGWLPSVLQSLEPYVSSEDIDKGASWNKELTEQLEDASFGILCITRYNLEAPWLNFEAGALSSSLQFEQKHVSPFLFDIKPSEIQGPLTQFQSTTFEEDDVKKLVHSLNTTDDTQTLEKSQLDKTFNMWWPDLEKRLTGIEVPEEEVDQEVPNSPGSDSSSEILEEVLELLRRQYRLLNSPEDLVPPDYLISVLRYHLGATSDYHPVFRDLNDARRKFSQLLSAYDEEESIPTSHVKDLWRQLRRPLNLILRRSRSSRQPTLFGDSRDN